MMGVPPLGFPKMRSWVGGMARPTFAASPLWSMRAKMVMFFARRMDSRRSRVSGTEWGLEWVWRLLQEPRRLWRRYLVEDMMIVPLALRELMKGRRARTAEDSSHA